MAGALPVGIILQKIILFSIGAHFLSFGMLYLRNSDSSADLKKLQKIFWVILLLPLQVSATHNRAGEITFRQVGRLTFEVTLVTYTDTRSWQADRQNITLEWGDNTSNSVARSEKTEVGNFIRKNVYKETHTYPGPGNYIIRFADPNRIKDILNISNSVNVPFYVETELQIDPISGYNRSPVLLQPPIDFARVGETFIHYPNAYDPDGDSLFFSLIAPRFDVDKDVPGYYQPTASQFFKIDNYTGRLSWTTPQIQGIYNIAILVEEFRRGKKIGYVVRDMQIIVKTGNNLPPKLNAVPDTCIEAGTLLKVQVKATDPDSGDYLTLTSTGGPYLQGISSANQAPNPAFGYDSVSGYFNWQTTCSHIRKRPYMVVFKVEDDHESTPLTDLQHMWVRVVGPAPQNLSVNVEARKSRLNWDTADCRASGYFIYRKTDSSGWQPGHCETGVPAYTGFKLIGQVTGHNNTSFEDDKDGEGLPHGMTYCYRVTAVYQNPGQFEYAEGYASDEICVDVQMDAPVIINNSIRHTGNGDGSLFLRWTRPLQLDTLTYPAPYQLVITRQVGFSNKGGQIIKSILSPSFSNWPDTVLADTFLATAQNPYTYRARFYYTKNGIKTLLDSSAAASSIFLTAAPVNRGMELRWQEEVPWNNHYYIIYRKSPGAPQFDSIGTTVVPNFSDAGLVNNVPYCYKVESYGTYGSARLPDTLRNRSQVVCERPRDTIPPCPPKLTVTSDCEAGISYLNWIFPDDDCAADAVDLAITFTSPYYDGPITIRLPDSSTGFTDNRNLLQFSMAGCYTVTVTDSFGNTSIKSNEICVENCPEYELPNVFTPNDDNFNDLFTPFPYRHIQKVECRILSRWGQEVFYTENPDIEWNGRLKGTGVELPEGTYFYSCRIHQMFLEGVKVREVTGTVTLMRKSR